MGNVLGGSVELLAENVKHSNEVEGLQYLRRVCSVLENMQTRPGKKISWNSKEVMEHTDFFAL